MTATNIVASKYLHGQLDTPERETGVRQLVGRAAQAIQDWGVTSFLFQRVEERAGAVEADLLVGGAGDVELRAVELGVRAMERLRLADDQPEIERAADARLPAHARAVRNQRRHVLAVAREQHLGHGVNSGR